MAETPPPAAPHGRYKRGLEGATFSLESNTETVPGDGRYYVMEAGEVKLATEDFHEATTEYTRRCKEFWLARLDSEQIPIRIAAAWGLLGLDPNDKEAQLVITEDGSPQERKRLDQAQSRRRAVRGRQASSNPPAAATAPAAPAAPEAVAAAAAPAAPEAEPAPEPGPEG